jgi:hypothetical protein
LAPGGLGRGFRFGPSGTKFNTPVTIKFHYTDDDIKGTLPQFIGIAFQDTDRIWYSLRNFKHDTINKIISTTTNHFTDFATFSDLVIVPGSENLKIGLSKDFRVMVLDDPSQGNELSAMTPAKSNENEVSPLRKQHEVNAGLVKNWSANGVIGGNSQYGTIVPQGAHCTYKAPSTKPSGSKNPVQLSAEINMRYKDPVTNTDYGTLKLNAPVKIFDDSFSYTLQIIYNKKDWYDAYAMWTVSDTAIMDITVKDDIAVISDYQNQNGFVQPVSQQITVGYETCTATWQPDKFFGPLNINLVTAYATSSGSFKSLVLQINNFQRITPAFNEVCGTSGNFTYGGENLGSDIYGAVFLLKDSDQIFHDVVTPELTYKLMKAKK